MRLRSVYSAVHLCRSQGHASPFVGALLPHCAGLRDFHVCIPVSADSKAGKKGKDRQASAASQLAEILPQHPTPPDRSPEELRDAESRVKEFSRKRMQELRAHQKMQKERRRLRYSFTLACRLLNLLNLLNLCKWISGAPVV